MPVTQIVLKDAANADVRFDISRRNGNTAEFVHLGDSLLDRSRLQLALKENGRTNRILGKLSVPSVDVNPGTGKPEVQYTEVGSFDLSSVLIASPAAANEFIAMFKSLVSSQVVAGMFTDGTQP